MQCFGYLEPEKNAMKPNQQLPDMNGHQLTQVDVVVVVAAVAVVVVVAAVVVAIGHAAKCWTEVVVVVVVVVPMQLMHRQSRR